MVKIGGYRLVAFREGLEVLRLYISECFINGKGGIP